MGFAWSSYIAQCTLLDACRRAGFPDAIAICDDSPTPVGRGEAYALATDDVMHFSTSWAGVAERRMDSLDKELLKRGLEKHPAKDELAVRDGTCLGIDLCDAIYFAPHPPRLAIWLVHYHSIDCLADGTFFRLFPKHGGVYGHLALHNRRLCNVPKTFDTTASLRTAGVCLLESVTLKR